MLILVEKDHETLAQIGCKKANWLIIKPNLNKNRDVAMPEHYGQSAIRHFDDALSLASVESWDGAGHLIGFAAECALKHGILATVQGIDNPHGHFPALIEVAKKHLHQRRQSGLYAVLKNENLMAGWKVELRYHETGTVDKQTYESWKQHTYSILHASGLRRQQ